MARTGFVFRFLKPCAVAALIAVVSACGGDGAPTLPEVVRVTVAGIPDLPLAPMQTAQLTANATYSDGAVSDVTETTTWSSTDSGVLTVSATGLVTATGPGSADVFASFGGASGSGSARVVALPPAYFNEGIEYGFSYQLDANDRVDNYRISRRDGISYPSEPADDRSVKECTGSLHGNYRCLEPNYPYLSSQPSMTGEAGRLVSMLGRSSFPNPIGTHSLFSYVYGPTGLSHFEEESNLIHNILRTATAMVYDERGRLKEVRTTCFRLSQGYGASIEKTAQIDLDSEGRLLHEDVTTVVIDNPYIPVSVSCPPDTTAWTYDAAGYMKTAGSTEYMADSDGWLTSRRRVSGAESITDSYVITRFDGRVAEEQFTQAEPRAFYGGSRPQRVRYEWGRLPAEPLFVPRALTGKNGADYLGIISSHHR